MTLRSHVLLLNNRVFGKRMENVKIYGDETDDKRAIAIHYFFPKTCSRALAISTAYTW